MHRVGPLLLVCQIIFLTHTFEDKIDPKDAVGGTSGAGLLRIFPTFALLPLPVIAAFLLPPPSPPRPRAFSGSACRCFARNRGPGKSNQRGGRKKVIMLTGMWSVNWTPARLLGDKVSRRGGEDI